MIPCSICLSLSGLFHLAQRTLVSPTVCSHHCSCSCFNWQDCFPFDGWIIFHCMCVHVCTHCVYNFLYSSIHQPTLRFLYSLNISFLEHPVLTPSCKIFSYLFVKLSNTFIFMFFLFSSFLFLHSFLFVTGFFCVYLFCLLLLQEKPRHVKIFQEWISEFLLWTATSLLFLHLLPLSVAPKGEKLLRGQTPSLALSCFLGTW